MSTPRLRPRILPIGIGGLVMAAAVAAMMSTASGALIAAATVARADVVPVRCQLVRQDDQHRRHRQPRARRQGQPLLGPGPGHRGHADRHGSAKDVVVALTIAYDILVGGLLVAILGGLVWKRGTGIAAAWLHGRGLGGDLAPDRAGRQREIPAWTASSPTIPSTGASISSPWSTSWSRCSRIPRTRRSCGTGMRRVAGQDNEEAPGGVPPRRRSRQARSPKSQARSP